MRPIRITVPAPGPSVPIPIDQYLSPADIAVALIPGAGGVCSLEHTLDDVFAEDFDPLTATWFPNEDPALTNAATPQDANYAFPPSAVRMVVTVASATIVVIQAGAVS